MSEEPAECPACGVPAVEIDKARGKRLGVKFYQCPRCGQRFIGGEHEIPLEDEGRHGEE